MDLKEKVLEYKDEVVKEIQNAVRVKVLKKHHYLECLLEKDQQKHLIIL